MDNENKISWRLEEERTTTHDDDKCLLRVKEPGAKCGSSEWTWHWGHSKPTWNRYHQLLYSERFIEERMWKPKGLSREKWWLLTYKKLRNCGSVSVDTATAAQFKFCLIKTFKIFAQSAANNLLSKHQSSNNQNHSMIPGTPATFYYSISLLKLVY